MNREALFTALITEHQALLHKVCNLYMDTADDRKDLFQEIVLQAWHAYPRFREAARFSTWLYRVALNTAITYLKKEKKQALVLTAVQLPELPETTDPAEEQLKALYRAIAGLSRVDKALVMLYLEDYPYQEIGDLLGITANHVAVKMNRIKIRLKEESKKYYQPA